MMEYRIAQNIITVGLYRLVRIVFGNAPNWY